MLRETEIWSLIIEDPTSYMKTFFNINHSHNCMLIDTDLVINTRETYKNIPMKLLKKTLNIYNLPK